MVDTDGSGCSRWWIQMVQDVGWWIQMVQDVVDGGYRWFRWIQMVHVVDGGYRWFKDVVDVDTDGSGWIRW